MAPQKPVHQEEPPKNTILLVENDKNIAGILTSLLSTNGNTVFKGKNFKEARVIAEKQNLKAALVEVFLKGENSGEGLDLIRFIRKNNPSTKIIVLTRSTSEEIKTAIKSMGIESFFVKPADIKEVFSELKKFGLPAEI